MSNNQEPITNYPVDPALAEHLDELTALANEVGAEGVFIIRGAQNARLTYDYAELDPPNIPGVKTTASTLSISFEIADGGILVLMRFPASDGKEPGIESR